MTNVSSNWSRVQSSIFRMVDGILSPIDYPIGAVRWRDSPRVVASDTFPLVLISPTSEESKNANGTVHTMRYGVMVTMVMEQNQTEEITVTNPISDMRAAIRHAMDGTTLVGFGRVVKVDINLQPEAYSVSATLSNYTVSQIEIFAEIGELRKGER